jgi:hypothetical protein
MSKYEPQLLLGPLRHFAKARNEALKAGFTDNGGAIHSVERILDILGLRLCYPHVSHSSTLKSLITTECSVKAHEARLRGDTVYIEHVMPLRAYARQIIGLIEAGATDDELRDHIKRSYRLVLLSAEETKAINKANRSRLSSDRIADAGIALMPTHGVETLG